MHVLDTNFLIALYHGDEAAIKVLESHREDVLLVPDIVAAEFLTDWKRARDREAAMTALEQEFTIAYGSREWVMAVAELRAELRSRKALIRHVDLWIAAWARLHAATVVSRNAKHFKAFGVDAVAW